MVKRIRIAPALGLFVLVASVAARCGLSSAALPFSATEYAVHRVCPPAPAAEARCLGLELVARPGTRAGSETNREARGGSGGSASAAEGGHGLRPADLQGAYFAGEEPDTPAAEAPQTVALVDAYNDPNAEAALAAYDREFQLPECTTADGCFLRVNQSGETGNPPFPRDRQTIEAKEALCHDSSASETERKAACLEVEEVDGWTLEISSDIEVAHAVCENCAIRLIEAASPEADALESAEQTAARRQSEGGLGATEISNSWGIQEPLTDSEAFNHPGVVITAAAGDFGYLNWTEAQAAKARDETYYSGVEYPAASPHVIAVGGTKLTLNASAARQSETVWNEDPGLTGKNEGAGGSGCSLNFRAQSWQREVPDWLTVGCGSGAEARRAVADVSADGDPYTGVAIYDVEPDGTGAWKTFGGTSVSAPIIAAMFALAGGAHGVAYPAQTLYSHLGSGSLYDVSAGGNGQCGGNYSDGCAGSISPLSPLDCGQGVLICNAAPGYDGPTGVGAPNGIAAFRPSVAEPDASTTETPDSLGSPPSNGSNRPGAAGVPAAATEPPHSARTRRALANRVTNLALTSRAVVSLSSGRPAVSRVAFTFTLRSRGTVRVSLAKRILCGPRAHWQVLRDSLRITRDSGRGGAHLHASGRLAPGD
jgi:hypothetical protein